MQLISSPLSSSSSSSYSSEERYCVQNRMEQSERLHPRLPPPPPPPPHFKGKRHPHRGRHSALPPHHRHHSVSQHRHHFPPPPYSLHSERGQLRVEPPKLPSKKVHKLHLKLMKAYKLPKGGGIHHHSTHVSPAPEAAFCGGDARLEHLPGCFLHYHEMDINDGAEGWRPAHEVGTGHNAHLHRLRMHPHPYRHHPCVKRNIGRGIVAPRHEATDMLNEPPM